MSRGVSEANTEMGCASWFSHLSTVETSKVVWINVHYEPVLVEYRCTAHSLRGRMRGEQDCRRGLAPLDFGAAQCSEDAGIPF